MCLRRKAKSRQGRIVFKPANCLDAYDNGGIEDGPALRDLIVFRLQPGEVLIELVPADMHSVIVPLNPLVLDQLLENMVAEGFFEEL